MYGLDIRTSEEKATGYGRILLPNATGSPNGEEVSPMERGTRIVEPCTKAGMVNGTMLAVERNIPLYVKSVLWLQNCALFAFIPSASNIKDFATSSSRTRWPGIKLRTTAKRRKDTWLLLPHNEWTTNYCRKWGRGNSLWVSIWLNLCLVVDALTSYALIPCSLI